MASDPTKPLLKLNPDLPKARLPRNPAKIPRPEAFPRADQIAKFGQRFRRLADVLARDPAALELRSDPSALAPERLLVFEVKGRIASLANAIARIPGLELVDEEELQSDDESPVIYLLVPDMLALQHIERLWQIWSSGESLPQGHTPWRDVFNYLRDLRPWGPDDRVQPADAALLEEEIFEREDAEQIPVEVEIVFRRNARAAAEHEENVIRSIAACGGTAISKVRLDDIAYHAILARLPVAAIRSVIERSPVSLAGIEEVMHIRPQSLVTKLEVTDAGGLLSATESPSVGDTPILAVLDGVPMVGHPLLKPYLSVDDLFGLESSVVVSERIHGSAMTSLIVHGDRNRPSPPLLRKVHCIPVLGAADRFPDDRLIVDLIYQAVIRMREGPDQSAPHVIIVNISLGNARRKFHGHLSPWARLLDRLAYQFGILFVVSAGNIIDELSVRDFGTMSELERAGGIDRARSVIRAIAAVQADRRLFSPAETVNGLTIGARNVDSVSQTERATARNNIDPFSSLDTANPSSALGPGFANAVKPDILMPGGREHFRVIKSGGGISVVPAAPNRGSGLRVAAPSALPAMEAAEAYTGGTSAAAALASRTAHRIHDALEMEYGEDFLQLSNAQRAVLLKALLVHPARWPLETATTIKEILGPSGKGKAPLQKDNIRRFIGFGALDPDDAVACASDRATFWAVGSLAREQSVDIPVPIPKAIAGLAQPHFISATLAWFTPVQSGCRAYRAVRMKILDPSDIGSLGVKSHGNQPDANQTARGTVYTRCWSGEKAAIVTPAMVLPLRVQREPETGAIEDAAVPFGLAVTISMPGQTQLYEEIRARLRPQVLQS